MKMITMIVNSIKVLMKNTNIKIDTDTQINLKLDRIWITVLFYHKRNLVFRKKNRHQKSSNKNPTKVKKMKLFQESNEMY